MRAKEVSTEEMDEPQNFERVRLKEIADILRGVTYKKDEATEKPADGLIPILRANNIQDRSLLLEQELVWVPRKAVSDLQVLRKGDIVIATSSGSKDLVGKAATLREDWHGSFGAFCAAVRPKEGIEPLYLAHFFEAPEYKDLIRKKALGVNINNLRRGDLEELEIPLAPLPEQRRIVSAIETQLGRLDAAVARLHAAKTQLKRYKQAVLKAAFTDEDWPIVRIGDVYEVFVGSTPSRAKPQFWNGTVPWVSSGEVAFCEIHETRERIATEALGNSEKRLHPAGSVMLAMIGEGKTRGQAAILRIPAAHNQNTAAIRMPDDLHSPEYLYYYFLYEYENTRRVGSGNNQMALNKSRIQDIELPLPDAEEQVRTALAIRDRFEVLAETETTLDAQLEQSTRLRQAVLKRAFEGRLV